jgi:hypothetical protein
MCVVFFLQNKKSDILLVILLFSTITNGEMLSSTFLNLQEIHLVRCLTHISHRYFAPGRSLVISSPSNYGDVQQELIAEIHRTAIWPVVVTVDGNISKPNKTHFIDRDGSYIILIPNGNIKIFKAEITGLDGDGNKWPRLWNSEARFVVAGANEYSMSQKTHIFGYLSKFRIYNCIIVNRERYIIGQENSRHIPFNNVDKSKKLGVYTWFPYHSSDCCTEVNDIILLDSWIISAQGHFTKNTDLFPAKMSNNLKGCPMKTVVRNNAWRFITVYTKQLSSNGSVMTYIQGLEMDLLRLVLKQMNMTFIHVPTPVDFDFGKGRTRNLIRTMVAKKAYIALGHVGTHFSFDPFLDSTNSYLTMGVRWYVPCSIKNPRWSSIFRILSVELWLVLIISIVIAAISTTLVGRYSCTSEWQGYKTITSSLTKVWAVILGMSVSTMPRTPSLRSLFLAWLCFSVAFSTVFQAFLTSFLIDSGYKTPIRNMDELFESGIKLACPPEYISYVKSGDETEASKLQRNVVNCSSYYVCFDWAKYQKNASILLADDSVEEYFADGDFVGENSKPLLCRIEDGVFFHYGLTMIMLHGDPLMRRVTEIIDRVVEAGLYNYWNSLRMYSLKLNAQIIAIVHQLDGYYSFNLNHMQTAFHLVLMGWCLSTLCFMFEVLYNRVISKRN